MHEPLLPLEQPEVLTRGLRTPPARAFAGFSTGGHLLGNHLVLSRIPRGPGLPLPPGGTPTQETLFLAKPLAASPGTLRLRLRFRQVEAEAFRLLVGRLGATNLAVRWERNRVARLELLRQQGGWHLLKERTFELGSGPEAGHRELEVEVAGLEVAVRLDGLLVMRTRLPGVLAPAFTVELEPQADILQIDDAAVALVGPDRDEQLLAGSRFGTTPLELDLPGALGLDRLGRPLWIGAIGLCALLLLALDLGILALARGVPGLAIRGGELVVLTLPARGLLGAAVLSVLDLPWSAVGPAVLPGLVAGGLHAAFEARHPPVPASDARPSLRWGAACLGVALYAGAAWLLLSPLAQGPRLPAPAAVLWVLGASPVLLLAAFALASRRPVLGLAFAAGQALALSPLVPAWEPRLGLTLLCVCLIPLFVVNRPTGSRPLRLGLGALALLAAAGFAELGLRSLPQLDRVLTLSALDSGRAWDMPEFATLFGGRERASIRLPRHGTVPLRKPRGLLRVVALGSSSTAGLGAIDPNSTFPKAMERHLNARLKRPVQVLNGGLVGARFSLLSLYLEAGLLPLQPDLVVIYFGHNGDEADVARGLARWRDTHRRSPGLRSYIELQAAQMLHISHPRVVRAFLSLCRLRSVLALLKLGTLLRPGARRGPSPGNRTEAVMEASARQAVHLCRSRGIPVLLIPEVIRANVLSGLGDYRGGPGPHPYYRIFHDLAAEARDGQVRFRSLLSLYSPDLARTLMIDEVHMNETGYQHLGQLIGEVVVQQGLLPGRGATPARAPIKLKP